MVKKELKKLRRRELVDIIYQMKKNEEQLQAEISSLKEEIQDKRLRLSQAGSVADAAATISNLFADAQKTADLYLNEIACMKEDAEKECTKAIEDAKQQAQQILAEGKKQYDALNERYKADYQKWQTLQADIEKQTK